METKKVKSTCEFVDCMKKMSLTDYYRPCKCNKRFCAIHRLYENHSCEYNFKIINHDLTIDRMKCVNAKVTYI